MAYETMIDVETAKERFMGNYALFSKFLYQFPERSLFSDLEKQIQEKNAADAFETAHAMKGIIGNLSLKKLEPSLFSVVEVLRKGELPSEEQWKALTRDYKDTVACIEEIQKDGTPLF